MESYKGLHPRDGVKGQGTGRLQDHLCPATPATGLELTYICERDKGALQRQFNFTHCIYIYVCFVCIHIFMSYINIQASLCRLQATAHALRPPLHRAQHAQRPRRLHRATLRGTQAPDVHRQQPALLQHPEGHAVVHVHVRRAAVVRDLRVFAEPESA